MVKNRYTSFNYFTRSGSFYKTLKYLFQLNIARVYDDRFNLVQQILVMSNARTSLPRIFRYLELIRNPLKTTITYIRYVPSVLLSITRFKIDRFSLFRVYKYYYCILDSSIIYNGVITRRDYLKLNINVYCLY